MKRIPTFRVVVLFVLLILCGAPLLPAQETIVAIRHGEKPQAGLGQLDCRGLNRALALPRVLISRFGRPDAIYAPDPADVDRGPGGHIYSYVRPLMTIEPTAIALGMPVNAQIGFKDIDELQAALTARKYSHAMIFVAWEHKMLNRFARRMLRSYGKNPDAVPVWPGNNYDRIYVFHIRKVDGKPVLSFHVTSEGLNGELSNACPGY
jgi:hypothetical protein